MFRISICYNLASKPLKTSFVKQKSQKLPVSVVLGTFPQTPADNAFNIYRLRAPHGTPDGAVATNNYKKKGSKANLFLENIDINVNRSPAHLSVEAAVEIWGGGGGCGDMQCSQR